MESCKTGANLSHRDQRFRQAEESFANQPRIREETTHGPAVQKPDITQIVLKKEGPLIWPGPSHPFPDREFGNYPSLPGPRQKMNQRRQQVMLHGEPAVGGLHKVPDPDPRDFSSELLVAPQIADMLDHRVTEHHVEGLVPKRKLAAVGKYPG